MKVAQIVLTKTQSGQWKIVVQSLRQTEKSAVVNEIADAINAIYPVMSLSDWEQLSLD